MTDDARSDEALTDAELSRREFLGRTAAAAGVALGTNVEYSVSTFFNRHEFVNSSMSDFRCNRTCVPRVSPSAGSTVNRPLPSDSHFQPASSWYDRLRTSTRSASMKAE